MSLKSAVSLCFDINISKHCLLFSNISKVQDLRNFKRLPIQPPHYKILVLCYLSTCIIFHDSVVLSFFQNDFFKLFHEYHQKFQAVDSDQSRHFFGPDLGPDCLHRMSAAKY